MYWEQLTSRRFGEVMGQVDTALMPIGTVEAHGMHCPLGSDNLAPSELCRRVEARHPDRVLVAPAIPYGHSWELEEWPGTLSLSSGVFEAYVAEVGKALVRWGMRNIVFVNGHGGNAGALGHAAETIADLGARVILTNWWIDYRDDILTVTTGQGHAGEDETSVALAIRPDLVDMAHAGYNPYRPRFRFKDQTARKTTLRHAVTGDGRGGTAEKGERILELVTDRLAALLEDVWEDRLFNGPGASDPQ